MDESRTFDLYEAAGFGKIGDVANPSQMPAPPGFDLGQWFKYLANVGQLSPIPKDMKFGEFPEGVKVLGGTYAIDGDEVLFAHSDEVPGATPNIEEVLAAAGAA